MKKPVYFILSFLLLSGLAFSQEANTKFYISGSEAMFPAINKLVTMWKQSSTGYANYDIKVTGKGSTIGIMNLLDGHAQLATSTRKMTDQEKDEFNNSHVPLKEFIVAREALTIVVSPENPVYKLTKAQVSEIFSGKIKNWKEVGGLDQPIRIFIRSNSSGCYEAFKETFFNDTTSYASNAVMLSSNSDIKKELKVYKNGISFLGYNSSVIQDANVKVLKVAVFGDTYIAPSQMTIDDGTYSLVRYCYIYTRERDYNTVKPFIEYILSFNVKDVWEDNGFTWMQRVSEKKQDQTKAGLIDPNASIPSNTVIKKKSVSKNKVVEKK